MPLFIHEAVDDKLNKKTTVIPKHIHDLALQVKGQYANNKTQDGYKTVNRLLDASYNKGRKNTSGISAKNDKSPKYDKNDGLVKFPTSAARKMIIDLKKENDFINPKAKDTIISYLQSDVKSKEGAVKDNNYVPKVPKTAKPINVSKANNAKQTVVGGVNVTVREERKKILIPENKLFLLKEYYRQLNIPFHHDTENYDYKENWEHYVDFLEEIGRYGTLPKSRWTNDDIFDKVEECLPYVENKLFEYDDTEDDVYASFIDYAFEHGLLDKCFDFNKFDKDEFEKSTRSITYYLSYIAPKKRNITNFGFDLFERFKNDNLMYRLGEFGFPDFLQIDKRGLIFVERSITIHSFDERIKNNEFIKAYKGVGECWTWKEGHGSPYCGDNNGITVTLQGWVDPSDVDWEETVYRNAYSLNEEMELYIPNATVEVFSISVGEEDEEKRKLPLKRPILVKA